MDRKSPEMAALRIGIERLEEARSPVDVVAVGADRNEAERRLAVARRPGGVAAKLGGVLLGIQIAAAAPALVADAPEVDVEGRRIAVGSALCSESIRLRLGSGVRRHIASRSVAILDLLVEIPRRKRSKIGGKVGLAPNRAAGVHELVKTVGVRVLLVPETGAGGTFGGGADAVAPVVAVGEAAAGPAQDGSFDGAHRVDEGLANAIDVGDFGAFANPDAVVDNAAELLDEVRVNLRRDGADGLSGKDVDARIGLGGLGQKIRAAKSAGGGGKRGGFQEGASCGRMQ